MPQFPSQDAASGIWALKKHKRAVQGENWPPLAFTDPNFEYTTLLLHGNGTNAAQNNTFIDGSSNNFSITRNGNPTQGSFSPYGSNWSNYFDGSGDYLTVSSNAAFQFGTGDFTVEAWVFAIASNSISSELGWFQISENAAGLSTSYANGVMMGFNNGNKIYFSINGDLQTGGTPQLNTWMHVAITRQSGIVKGWLNGTEVVSYSNGSNLTASNVAIGGYYSTGYTLNGYVSNLRIVKGTAVYTTNFTPSTTPLTAITNTSLLTCHANQFRDGSINNFFISRFGDSSIQKFSPFSPTQEYIPSVHGGSAHLDNSGDSFLIANNTAFDFGAGEFTMEGWFYQTANTGSQSLYSKYGASSNDSSFSIEIGFGYLGVYLYHSGGVLSLNGINVSLNQWNHFAVQNRAGLNELYVNGARVDSRTAVTLRSTTAQVGIGTLGTNYTGSWSFGGYFSDFRIRKGAATYSGTTYTVPTQPLTNVANTSLLMNFTNAGIIDHTRINNLETIGNAQISTSVSKFGGGSVALTGAGDYLRNQQASALWDFGTGSWTIEGWIYPTSLSSAQAATLYSGSASSFLILLFSNKVRIFENSISLNKEYTLTLSTNTWQHIAIVRNGAISPTVYINGTGYTTAGGTYSGVYGLSTDYPEIGYDSTYPSDKFYGYIDDLRITKGVARYTANFTPPGRAFPDL